MVRLDISTDYTFVNAWNVLADPKSCQPNTVVQRASIPNTQHPDIVIPFPHTSFHCYSLTPIIISSSRPVNTCIIYTRLHFGSASAMYPSHGPIHLPRFHCSIHPEKETFFTDNQSSTIMEVITMVESRISRAARTHYPFYLISSPVQNLLTGIAFTFLACSLYTLRIIITWLACAVSLPYLIWQWNTENAATRKQSIFFSSFSPPQKFY